MRLTLFFLLLLAFGCAQELVTHVDRAGDLIEGSPVELAGVKVGEVKSLSVVGGDTPVEVRISVEREHADALAGGACAISRGAAIELETGERAEPIHEDVVAPCAQSIFDGAQEALDAIRGGIEALDDNLEAAGGAAGERLGEGLRGAAEGVVRGATMGGTVRDLGRAAGENAREFEEGAIEGATPPAP